MYVPGTDGGKMSKSQNNTIDIFADPSEIKKVINKQIITDATPLEEPKDPMDKAEEQRKNYGKARGEDIFTAEDVQDLNPNSNITKYKADEQIGQCTVEEVQDEEAEEEQPTIEEVDPTEAAPAEKPAELPEIRQKKE